MPRTSRIDAPEALHHVIVRGIGRRKIFNDDYDRDFFLDRLGTVVEESRTGCYAWALIPNHFHLFVRTGDVPISTVMQRLLTGYAMRYNRRHRRSGHLFQNRYKSILCQEDPYFLELVRYIHLNPVRARLVTNLGELDKFPYTGHCAIMGKRSSAWQNIDEVLARYGKRLSQARRSYRAFLEKGLSMGKRPELIGGGLVRSMGGWAGVKALRQAKALIKGDERILGDSDFVLAVLKHNEESYDRRSRLKAKGVNLDALAQRVSQLLNLSVDQVWSKGKYRPIVAARSLLCFWAVRELGISATSLSVKFEVSATAISRSVMRGEALAREHGFKLEDI